MCTAHNKDVFATAEGQVDRTDQHYIDTADHRLVKQLAHHLGFLKEQLA